MIIYEMEYAYDTHRFRSIEKLMKALRSWWRADGSPYWYTPEGRRTHFPTLDEVLEGLEDPDGFYRDCETRYSDAGYVTIKRITVTE